MSSSRGYTREIFTRTGLALSSTSYPLSLHLYIAIDMYSSDNSVMYALLHVDHAYPIGYVATATF